MLHQLPPEVQEKIYNHLQVVDLQNLSCCSYKLDDILKEYLWTCVKVKKSHLLDQHFHHNIRLKNVKHAQSLHIVAHAHEDEQRKVIRKNFNRVLKYCNPKVLYAFLTISDVLEGIVSMCNLTALYLDGTCATDSDILMVSSRMTSLKLLSIRMTNITDAALSGLHKLSHLEVLDAGNTRVTHQGFQYLNSLTHLERLTLDRCANILNPTCLSQLSSLINLKTLNMSSSGVNDAGISSLSHLTSLNELDLSHSYNKITGRFFSSFAELKYLRKLKVSWCTITDANVESIATISSLQHLDIRQNPMTDTGVKELQGLPLLEVLDVSGCGEVTVVGVCGVSTMVRLRWLAVSGTKVTDKDVMELQEHGNNLIVVKKY